MAWKHNGVPAGNGWNRSVNNAEWGFDELNRTAGAKSNMFDNRSIETQYFYADADSTGAPLTGDHLYAVTLAAGELPRSKASGPSPSTTSSTSSKSTTSTAIHCAPRTKIFAAATTVFSPCTPPPRRRTPTGRRTGCWPPRVPSRSTFAATGPNRRYSTAPGPHRTSNDSADNRYLIGPCPHDQPVQPADNGSYDRPVGPKCPVEILIGRDSDRSRF